MWLLIEMQDAKQLYRLRRIERNTFANIFANISADDLSSIWQRHDLSSFKTIAIMNRFLSFWRRWNAFILHYNFDEISERYLKLLIAMQNVQQLHKRKHFEMSRLIVKQIFLIENSYFQLMKIIDFKKYEDKINQNFFRSIIRVKRIYWTFFYRICSISNTCLNFNFDKFNIQLFINSTNKAMFTRFNNNNVYINQIIHIDRHRDKMSEINHTKLNFFDFNWRRKNYNKTSKTRQSRNFNNRNHYDKTIILLIRHLNFKFFQTKYLFQSTRNV